MTTNTFVNLLIVAALFASTWFFGLVGLGLFLGGFVLACISITADKNYELVEKRK